MLGTPLVAFSLLTLSTYELWSTLAVQVFSLGNQVRQLFPFVAPKPRKANFPVNGMEPEVTPVAQFYVNSKNATDPLQLAENWEMRMTWAGTQSNYPYLCATSQHCPAQTSMRPCVVSITPSMGI